MRGLEAATLAEFRGAMLILGLRSLSPEVARALAKSQAATVWLRSVTAVLLPGIRSLSVEQARMIAAVESFYVTAWKAKLSDSLESCPTVGT